ncbi:MBL fold metallo-hydrolase [Hymenobacter ruricola]|uniref:MBL fold metallo-hydrolase n=1 Tax=Hymenobacter ruricola TaxID=2791023 RepID=A0ABS0I614_9BACT|nr:MBL fold metallo-hydrolase [Hymenobacter ruricola]MBF9222417.1 MBL fold metallo-hydrolase [Hymenobacter ruricola]
MDTVAAGVTQLRIQRFVNVYFVETGTPGEWVLIDTGLPGSEKTIIAAADQLFYPGTRPEAILLTHGHLDHLGSARELADHWKVPVIVHPLELPYVTGQALYPPRDPTVGGSLAFMSRFFPTQLPNLEERVQALDANDPSTPFLMNWRWLHVPGHAPGQLAFFREADGVLLGADAFATCHHDSVPAVLLGLPKISRAGTPFNYDWEAARKSVQTLADLAPKAIGCGHGPVIKGPEAAAGLRALADNYPVPSHGRYVHEPARTDASGVEHLPPAPKDKLPMQAALIGAGVLAAGAAWLLTGGRRKGKKSTGNYQPAAYKSTNYQSGSASPKGYQHPDNYQSPPIPPLYRGGVGD